MHALTPDHCLINS